jgi:phage protein D
MTAPASASMIAGAEVRIGGTALSAELAARLVEVRVDDNLMLPDAFLIRIADPGLENVDKSPLEIGAEVEIRLAGGDAAALTTVVKGQIATLEPEFGAGAAILAARGYDHSHVLHRSPRTQTYQNMTAGDIARKIARRYSLTAGTIQDGDAVHPFVQQSQETDWAFLWRLAAAIDFEVVVVDRTLHFRPAGGPSDPPVALRWGEKLLSFRPRVTGVQQLDRVLVRGWDPTRGAVIEATASRPDSDSKPGVGRNEVVSGLGGGDLTVSDRPIASQREADGLARSVAAHLANVAVEAEGTCQGDAALRAGSRIDVQGVGPRFGGTYTISATSHVFRGTHGYRTHFTVSGRAPRTLVDLMTPAPSRPWGATLAVGVVTNNNDPDGLGRVRVRYPSLDDDTEGWWARVAGPGAGDQRGLLMLPVQGDEVVVGFEHGDVRRPYVLGALWNGSAKPGPLAEVDGTLRVRSAKRIGLAAKDDVEVKSEDGDLTTEAKGALHAKAGDTLSNEGKDVVVKASSGKVTIEGATELELKAGGASIKLTSAGMVQVSGSQISLG